MFLGLVLIQLQESIKMVRNHFYKIPSWTKISCLHVTGGLGCYSFGQVISLLEAESLETSAAEAVPGALQYRGPRGFGGFGKAKHQWLGMEAVENKMLSTNILKPHKFRKKIMIQRCVFSLYFGKRSFLWWGNVCRYHDVHQSIMIIQTLEHRPGLKPVNTSNMVWPNFCWSAGFSSTRGGPFETAPFWEKPLFFSWNTLLSCDWN